ncbi:hypothetical protein A7985_11515 [Pseudoalteromonas luteoviolacea]|uniref:Galactosyltransferase C-terminal domain-containing protein n=1 Tax=Pseudoalteromonas luteoviolacea TaxID=43657 RepID=A0A1C0TQK2_9GAMM|nr:glycosyltransferase family A protein [Pseudoalteromonas luteoviolacea]OCQ21248.1 hypothetical protein A7985_11515 [Pseudoalteromonas luteoviolacea]
MIDVIIPATNKKEVEKVINHLISLGDFFGKIIIVDFDKSSPSMNFKQIEELNNHVDLSYIFVTEQAYFNKSIAINIGYELVVNEYVLICDADVLLDKAFFEIAFDVWTTNQFIECVFSPEFVIESDNGEVRKGPGICLLKSAHFKKVAGYSSDYLGWGMEDVDFLKRLEYIDVEPRKIAHAIHLSHSDEVRTRNYHCDSVSQMRLENRQLFSQKHESHNLYGTLFDDFKHVCREVCLC